MCYSNLYNNILLLYDTIHATAALKMQHGTVPRIWAVFLSRNSLSLCKWSSSFFRWCPWIRAYKLMSAVREES